jgi:hypothetical protein
MLGGTGDDARLVAEEIIGQTSTIDRKQSNASLLRESDDLDSVQFSIH